MLYLLWYVSPPFPAFQSVKPLANRNSRDLPFLRMLQGSYLSQLGCLPSPRGSDLTASYSILFQKKNLFISFLPFGSLIETRVHTGLLRVLRRHHL